MLIKGKCQNDYCDAVVSYTIDINKRIIGDLFCTTEFWRGWHVVLCGRLGYSNAQFATEEGALKYMELVANATVN